MIERSVLGMGVSIQMKPVHRHNDKASQNGLPD
jgi:hypothetical protein